MDMELVNRIEHLLNYKLPLTPHEINEKLEKIEVCFRQLYPNLNTYTIQEKSIFLRLLSRTNELIRMSMEHKMKLLNLTPEKLKAMFEKAKHSGNPADIGMLSTYQHMQEQYEDIRKSMSKANAKLTEGVKNPKATPSPEQQKLRRHEKWRKS